MTWWWISARALALPPGAVWGVTGGQAGAYLGLCSGVLDANGDGLDDAFVSAHGWAHPEPLEGAVAVFPGALGGLAASPSWSMEGGAQEASAGSCAARAGDVDGDGYDDLLVGAPGISHPEPQEGVAVLYRGGPNGLRRTVSFGADSGDEWANLGRGLSGVGDVDGDGYDDVVIAAPAFDGRTAESGRVSLYRGGPNGLAAAPSWYAESDDAFASFGFSVAGADVNGDGYSDIVVGAYRYGRVDGGAAFVWFGHPGGPSAAWDWRVVDPQPGAEFGLAVAGLGDVDGDGFDDVAVGAPHHGHGEAWEGVVSVFRGSPTGPSTIPDWTAESNLASAELGWSVAGGDLDGDGFADLAVGAPDYAGEGAVQVFRGSPTGLGSVPSPQLASGSAGSGFGRSVTIGGDTDGDGRREVMVGANTWTAAFASEGGLFVFEP